MLKLLAGWVDRIYVDALEISTSSVAVAWGFWLLLPNDTYGSSSTYDLLARLAPEWMVGLAMLALGVLQTIALLRQWDAMLGRLALVGFFMWTVITLAFLFGNPFATAFIVYGHVAMGNAILTVRYRNAK